MSISSHAPSHNPIISENPEQKKEEKIEEKIRDIIRESFSLLIQSPANKIIVDTFCKNPNTTNKTAIDIKIKKIIANKLGNDDYLDYNEKISEQLSDVDKIKKMAIRNLAEREKLEQNFASIICRWFSITDPAKNIQIKDISKQASTENLKLLSTSPKRAKKFLIENGFDDTNFFTTDLRDFLQDYHINIPHLEESEKSAIQSYIETQKLNSTILEILLSYVKNNTEKLKILNKLTGSISFSTLIQYKLINDIDQENIVQKVYENSINQDIRNNLTHVEEWEIKDLIRGDLQKNAYQLSIEDLSETTIINDLLTNNNLITSINSIFDEYAEEEEKASEKEKETIKTFDEMKTFLGEYLNEKQKAKISGKNIHNIDLDGDNAINRLEKDVFISLYSGDKQTIWKITHTNSINSSGKKGISFNVLDLHENPSNNSYTWKVGEKNLNMPYKDFLDGIVKNLNSESITNLHISELPPEDIKTEEVLNTQTLAKFQEIINQIDENNTSKPFEVGCVFTLKFGRKGEEDICHIRVTQLDESSNTITIRAHDETEITIPWGEFIKGVSERGVEMNRLGKMDTVDDFVENAFIPKRLYKDNNSDSIVNAIDPKIFLDSSEKVSMKAKGKDNKEEEVPVWGFKHPEKPAFIQVTFKHNIPKIVETIYSSDQQELEIGRMVEKDAAKHKKKSEQEKLRKVKKKRSFTYDKAIKNYEGLLQLMTEKGYTQPVHCINLDGTPGGKTDPITQHENNLSNEEYQALNGELPDKIKFKGQGLFGSLGNLTTIGDLLVMGKMTKNAIEQYFEKNSKLRSAESLYKLFNGTLGENNSLTRAALKEFTNEVGSLIDGKIDMIRRLKGKEMRIEIQKILITKPPKAVDILAAAIVTAEMGGHMYPDSFLMELQGERYIWFEQICLAIGVDPKFEMNRCRAKVAGANEGSAHHPSEEELITQLCKFNQSNKWIQAIGGGPKFWKKPGEGRNGQKEKGTKEAGEYASAGDRAEYAVAKMKSNEFEITLGAIDVVAGKSMGSKVMGIGFVWAASNAPNYVHKDTGNSLRNVFYNGNTFHGFYFGKEKVSGDLYKNTINIALQYRKKMGLEKADAMLKDYQQIIVGRDEKPYTHNEDLIANLWNFWKKYHEILHPILQGTDPLLTIAMQDTNIAPNERDIISKYLSEFGENNSMIFEKIDGKMRDNLLSVNATYQVDNSFPLIMKEPPYRVFGSILSNIGFDSVTKDMSGADRNGIWGPIVVDYMSKYLRDNELFIKNPEFQKKQFLIFYEEIMKKMAEKMDGIKEEAFNSARNNGKFKHLSMLESIGFDVDYKTVLQGGWRDNLENSPESTFLKFKNSTGKTGSLIIQDKIHKRFGSISLSGSENDKVYENK